MGRRDREREKNTGSGRTPAENSEKPQGSIFVSSFQLKVPRTNCEEIALPSSSRACEHVYLKNIYIYKIGYCYEDRRYN